MGAALAPRFNLCPGFAGQELPAGCYGLRLIAGIDPKRNLKRSAAVGCT